MNLEGFSEWLTTLSLLQKIRALSLVYSSLTISTRSLFSPDIPEGKQAFVLRALQGINETHHTLANQLVSYATDERKAYSIDALCDRLLDTANRYGLDEFLTSAIKFAQTRR